MKLTAWEHFPYPVRKAWRVMRITTLLILVISLHLSAKTTAQKITLNSNDISIEQFFKQLKKQTGYSFLLENGVISKDEKISVNVKDVSLEMVLDQILKPINLSYKIENKTVYILKSNDPISSSEQNLTIPPPIDIHGHVVDSLGNPLAGVSVTVKGGKTGTSTDANGNFILYGVNENATLVISNVGYADQLIKVKGKNALVISLKPHSTSLAEVVVNKGYYSTTQALNTGDVTVVSGADISKQPVSDPILALDGRVPGLYIQQTSGVPGAYSTIMLRGQNSLANGNSPFFIVDGVPYNSTSPTSPIIGGGVLGNPINGNPGNVLGASPFNDLNPADIESIEVLKDADATAIYGSRGANGVILITTKKGKAGTTQFTVNAFSGTGRVTQFMHFLNTPQYLQMRHEALSNDGKTVGVTDYDLNGDWDTTRYTNWQKVLIGNTSTFNNLNATVSGGNSNTQFRINGGYTNQGTVYPGSYSDQKAMASFNLTHSSANQRLHLQLTANYVYDYSNLPGSDLAAETTLAPDAPALYDGNGNLNWQPVNGSASWTNPLAYTLQNASAKTDNLVSNFNFSYLLFPGLQLKSNFGYSHLQNNQSIQTPGDFNPPPYNDFPAGRSNNFATTDFGTWIIEPQLIYEKELGKGKLNILVGTTFQQNLSNAIGFNTSGYSSDALIPDPQAAETVTFAGSNNVLYHYDAGFGRINYSWEEKYLINLTARRDGSSRFGPSKQFGNFGAVGVGWIFSREDFVQKSLPFLSFGKLRASYGTAGNDQIPDYQFLSTYSPQSQTYQGLVGLFPNNLTNPYFAWELNKKLEAGIELGFIKDRIMVAANYYRNRSGNQLVGYPLPNLAGFPGVEANLAATVQNSGGEFTINTTNIKSRDLSWTTSINLSIPRNKLIAYPNLATSGFATYYIVGKSLFIRKQFHYAGVNDSIGTFQYVTSQGLSNNPTYPDDLMATRPITQNWYGGIENSFGYKSFSLSFLIQVVSQTGYNYLGSGYIAGPFNENRPTAVLDRWQKPGDIATYGRFSTENASDPSGWLGYSDFGLCNTSFIRLKNVELSYHFSKQWLKKLQMTETRFYIQGQNLLLLTNHYIGFDPETGGTGLPPLRVIVGGLQISF